MNAPLFRSEWRRRKRLVDPRLKALVGVSPPFDAAAPLNKMDRCAIEEYPTENGLRTTRSVLQDASYSRHRRSQEGQEFQLPRASTMAERRAFQ